jgi:hypothetical protein
MSVINQMNIILRRENINISVQLCGVEILNKLLPGYDISAIFKEITVHLCIHSIIYIQRLYL